MDENENNELNENMENNIEETIVDSNDEYEKTDIANEEVVENEEECDEKELIERKKGNKILPIIAIILAGVVVIAVVVLAILSFTSPKNTFFRLINGSFSGISKNISKLDRTVWGNIYKIDTSSKLSLDADITGAIESDSGLINEWFNNFKDFKLTAHEDIDLNNDYGNTTAKFVLNGEDFMSGKLVKNKNIVSIDIDDVTEGFITVDNDNLNELWDKIGYDGPESLGKSSSLLKNFNFTKKDMNDLKGLLSRFAIGFSKAFNDEDFAYGKGTVEYDEGTIDCKTMDMIVNNINFNNGIISGLEEISKEDKYLDALYKAISMENILSGYEPKSRYEFGIAFEEMLQQIKDMDVGADNTTGFIVRLYYKGSNVIKVDLLSRDYNTKIFSFIAINNKNSSYYKFSQGVNVYEDKVTTIDKVTTHNITISYINYETREVLDGYGSELVIKIDNTNKNEGIIGLIEKVKNVSNLDETDVNDSEPVVVKDYTIKFSTSGNDNSLDVILKDGDTSYSSTFTLKALLKEKADFENIEIKDEDTFDTTKKSDEEIIAKKDKIIENWNNNIVSDSNRVSQFQIANALYLNNSVLNSFVGY